MPLLLENLTKHYAAPDGTAMTVLDVPHFELADGEHVALLGGSGTGKTTLLHSIAGIVRPDGGRVIFRSGQGETDVAALPEADRDGFRGQHIGYIFQTHHLLPGFTALENVLLGLTFTGRKADPAWARHLLTEVGLGDRLDYKPAKLSVGQQQRVAVARALANRPKLVLADEPTGALDPQTAQQVLELIRTLCREVNASLILVTHDMNIAGQLERVVRLDELNRRGQAAVGSGQ
ncbi:MAG TPA: ABC transporter ATP-binding protein [Tepidisphaeraceae bacterium]|jgi:putative ABC transport system ATP-binding protein